MNIVFGAAGHAKEIEFFIRSNKISKVDFFVSLSSNEFLKDIPVISETYFFDTILPAAVIDKVEIYVALGSNKLRKKIVSKINSTVCVKFPNLILSDAFSDFNSIILGEGNILFPKTIFTVDIKIGNHNHFNLGSSVSHDCSIGNYNTFSPGVKIAGNVSIGNENFFGIGSVIIDNVTIGDDIIIGAGTTVIRDILIPGTYVGIPAKKIK